MQRRGQRAQPHLCKHSRSMHAWGPPLRSAALSPRPIVSCIPVRLSLGLASRCRDVTREVATPVQWVEEHPLKAVASAHGHAEARTARPAPVVYSEAPPSAGSRPKHEALQVTRSLHHGLWGSLVPARMGHRLGQRAAWWRGHAVMYGRRA